MNNKELEDRLAEAGDVDFVRVEGDGYHYQLTIVSDAFIGKSKVARQQWVYAKLKDYITTGSLHAISMKTLTKAEWEKNHG
ncbi:BolA like protein [Legionella lansingensis]|uniref:BolA like protein n=1 Tax=Legionella lansingensis TaxID=45067 RepID=A0A0W0W0D2_9GAMM|nr:BolA/IbaG family iron-sulfur metabolism protein [Legionella lansingensis]KTD25705.1 BolA like protein [Legionella lansingensis]SNV49206.1 BolA like protein [Legionella lansingensis]